ncbi:OB-fold-containig protein [Fulvimarina sp. MAC8]|uniref:OB-fold-containig protein n=1 Tax=Fulvimarina sp. MAC8 TaxID=3162874 RepID=UPI0032EBD8E0
MVTDFLLPSMLPFTIALGLIAAIAVIEAVTALAGSALSGLFDGFLPDIDTDLDISADGAFDGSPLQQAMAWLSIGQVPVLVLLILFLLGFGGSGLVIQQIADSALGAPLSAWVAVIPATLSGFCAMRWLGRGVARLIPQDETAAIDREALIGRGGVVTGGTAKRGLPAQVRIRDEHGTSHYLLAEPEDDSAEFGNGTPVIVVSVDGAKARVIPDPYGPARA